jgi:hypothetical protein
MLKNFHKRQVKFIVASLSEEYPIDYLSIGQWSIIDIE